MSAFKPRYSGQFTFVDSVDKTNFGVFHSHTDAALLRANFILIFFFLGGGGGGGGGVGGGNFQPLLH